MSVIVSEGKAVQKKNVKEPKKTTKKAGSK